MTTPSYLGMAPLELLAEMGNPSTLVHRNSTVITLVFRGLLAAVDDTQDWFRITPAGLRKLAEEMKAGHLPYEPWKYEKGNEK